MTAAALQSWVLAAVPDAGAVFDRDPVDALATILFEAEEHAFKLLRAERAAAEEAGDEFDPTLPDLAIRDAAGRAIAGARLEREPGTDRFTLVLLTTIEEVL